MSEGHNYRGYRDRGGFIILAALTSADIEKALKTKEHPIIEGLKKKLPSEINDIVPLFSRREAEKLALYRKGINYYIDIYKQIDRTLYSLL